MIDYFTLSHLEQNNPLSTMVLGCSRRDASALPALRNVTRPQALRPRVRDNGLCSQMDHTGTAGRVYSSMCTTDPDRHADDLASSVWSRRHAASSNPSASSELVWETITNEEFTSGGAATLIARAQIPALLTDPEQLVRMAEASGTVMALLAMRAATSDELTRALVDAGLGSDGIDQIAAHHGDHRWADAEQAARPVLAESPKASSKALARVLAPDPVLARFEEEVVVAGNVEDLLAGVDGESAGALWQILWQALESTHMWVPAATTHLLASYTAAPLTALPQLVRAADRAAGDNEREGGSCGPYELARACVLAAVDHQDLADDPEYAAAHVRMGRDETVRLASVLHTYQVPADEEARRRLVAALVDGEADGEGGLREALAEGVARPKYVPTDVVETQGALVVDYLDGHIEEDPAAWTAAMDVIHSIGARKAVDVAASVK